MPRVTGSPWKVDRTGERFGKWTVLRRFVSSVWLCRCDCGIEQAIQGSALTLGKSTCCKRCASLRHGMEGTKVYNVWAGMKQRCQNPKYHGYAEYGGRGITVCESWQKFENFYADMGDPPTGSSINRIDNDGNYEPGNVEWSTPKEQQRNRRVTRMLEFRGTQRPLTELAEEFRIERHTLQARLKMGWSVEKALTTPVRDMSAPRGGT